MKTRTLGGQTGPALEVPAIGLGVMGMSEFYGTPDEKETFSRPISIRVTTDDREGMLADLSAVFSKHGVNISEANCRADRSGHAVNTFKCGILDLDQLRKVVKTLESVKGVHSVERARAGDG